MAGASELFDKMDAYKPAGWNWDGGQGVRQWLDALSQGFVAMWAAGVLAPYTWPGTGPQIHTHSVTSMPSATMLAPLTTLGYSGADIGTFFSDVCGAVASYVQSNTTLATQSTAITPHDHIISSVGSGSGLESAIDSAISFGGVHISDLVHAIAFGIVDFLTDYGTVDLSVPGNPHTHTLST